ncbi:hypothetical protein EMCRGX_G032059 [Ephydatia muelleri]
MTAGSVAVPTIIPLKVVGGRKYMVDTTTPIELKSATKDATVFYTLDGYRPNPFDLKRLGQPSTFAYKAPFALPTGKVTIRAVALSADGFLSSCVTKTFVVLQADGSGYDGVVVMESGQDDHAPTATSPSHRQSRSRDEVNDGTDPVSSPSSPPSSANGASISSSPVTSSPLREISPAGGQKISPAGGRETLPGREMEISDKQICITCWMPYSKDTKYKFCLHCGSCLPPVTQGPAMNPFQGNAHESISAHQRSLVQPPVTADGLTPRPLPPLHPAGPLTTMRLTSQGGHMVCSMCGRTNAPDIRFCDWCGSRPNVPAVSVPCQSCLMSVDSSSRYCHSCGAVMKAPARQSTDLCSHQKSTVGTQVEAIAEAPPTVIKTCDLVPISSVSTQTDGPFGRKVKKTMESSLREKATNLRAYSPGKGLWRVQLEHIANHLKAHTQSCDEFQENIGNYEMGKLLRACAMADQDRNELNVNLTFALKHEGEHKADTIGEPGGNITTAPDNGVPGDGVKKPPKGKGRRSKAPDPHALVSNQLVTELLSPHEAKCDVIQHLLEQGAGVNTLTGEGVPVLSLAVRTGCLKCTEALVEGGAALGAQAKGTGNSALHEAIMEGPQAKSCVDLLLRLGADPRLKNRSGESPCELASHLGHKELVRLFASYVAGQLIKEEMSSLRSL